MRKLAIMFYGPPGSGKGTQANLLAEELGLIHFDTGHFMESIVHDPALQKSKIIVRERELFDTGKLMTPSFIFKYVSRQVDRISKAGWGIVFSGSPRTLYEAQKLFPKLDKVFGRQNTFLFVLKIDEKISSARNSQRLLCSVCKRPLLTAYYPSKNPKYCPVCAGPLYKRTLDNKEAIAIRVKEYENRTYPIFDLAKKNGYRINELDGNLPPYLIFKEVIRHFKK